MPDARRTRPAPAAADAKNQGTTGCPAECAVASCWRKEDEVHPLPQAGKNAAPSEPPPTAMPYTRSSCRRWDFRRTSPTRPEDEPGLDAVLLVRTVHVEPEYEFSGHVDAPPLVPASARAILKMARREKRRLQGTEERRILVRAEAAFRRRIKSAARCRGFARQHSIAVSNII